MCGIAGFSLASTSTVDPSILAASLLLSIESRGRDASGAAWVNGDGKAWARKDPERAEVFIDRILQLIEPDVRTAILHTRAATKGDPSDPNNNHPIVLPGICGVHNGMLTNDDEVIEKLSISPVGEVDSEVIFQIISQHGGIDAVGEHLHGDAAIAYFETRRDQVPAIHLAHLGGRTAVWGTITIDNVYQGIMFASTAAALQTAAHEAGVICEHDPKTMVVAKGQMVTFDKGAAVTFRDDVPTISRPTTYSQSHWNRAEGGSTDWRRPFQHSRPQEPHHGTFDHGDSYEYWWHGADAASKRDDLSTMQRFHLRDLLKSNLFKDTDANDWEFECDNGSGSTLWWNEEIMTFAARWASGLVSGCNTIATSFPNYEWTDTDPFEDATNAFHKSLESL